MNKPIYCNALLVALNRPTAYCKAIGKYVNIVYRPVFGGGQSVSGWRRILPDEETILLPLAERRAFYPIEGEGMTGYADNSRHC